MGRRYYFKSRSSGEFLFIEHGGRGFQKADFIKCPEDLTKANLTEGVRPNEIMAAEICALSGDWSKFTEIVNESSSD